MSKKAIVDFIPATAAANPSGFDPAHTDVNITLSGINNITATRNLTGGWNSTIGIASQGSGKYYFEFLQAQLVDDNGQNFLMGLAESGSTPIGGPQSGYVRPNNGTGSASGIFSYASGNEPVAMHWHVGDTLAFATDLTNKKAWIAFNNNWGGSPTLGTNPVLTWSSVVTLFPGLSMFYASDAVYRVVTIKTGSSNQKYTPPTGFTAWG